MHRVKRGADNADQPTTSVWMLQNDEDQREFNDTHAAQREHLEPNTNVSNSMSTQHERLEPNANASNPTSTPRT